MPTLPRIALIATLLPLSCPGTKPDSQAPDDSVPPHETGLDPDTVPLEGACQIGRAHV